jgi:glycosyltransferase involved in cell wall biosynthesis
MPALTVLMPVFNGARYLRASIDSVLGQTFEDFELLIVDDASTDESLAIARSYTDHRLRVIAHDRNRGLSASLNHGLEVAATEFIARQDQDDLSSPARLAAQHAFLQDHPDVALLGSQALVIDAGGRPLAPIDRCLEAVTIRWYGLFDNPFVHSSVMFRRSVALQYGGFEGFSQDWALWSRIMDRHGVANLRERLVTYRAHESSIIGALNDTSTGDGYRERFEAGIRDIVTRRIGDVFSADGVSTDDVTLMARFIPGVRVAEIRRFLATFRRLLDLYRRRHPETRTSIDFRRALARQYDAIAYRLIEGSRIDALAVYGAALAVDPAIARDLSWPRAFALLLLGRSGRNKLGRSRSARIARGLRQSHHG